jgi:DNA-binding MarR family transcriptional regulator
MPIRRTTRADAGGDVTLVDELADLVTELAERLRRHFAEAAAELGLSAAQGCALHQLDGPLAMGELAERIGCEPSNVTFLVDRLEARELVERQPHPRSRRTKRLVLTADGEELRERLHARVARDPLPLATLSPRQQQQLRTLLTRALGGGRTRRRLS